MKGFRPEFYNEDPFLHTIEMLGWAAGRDGFTLRQIMDEFSKEFTQYGDPSHEASERLRKLLKSGMILVVTPGVLATFKAALNDPKAKDPGITEKAIHFLEKRLGEIAASKEPGRKPRLYRVTQVGMKYVQKRMPDLEKIFNDKHQKKGEQEG
jgi:hypothetical protein